MPDPSGEARVVTLAMRRLRELSDGERENSRQLRALELSILSYPIPPSG
jgi:hypothetical protein